MAREHLKRLRQERGHQVGEALRPELRRLMKWQERRHQALNAEIAAKGRALRQDEERRYTEEREEIDKLVDSRKRWVNEGMRTAEKPYLRLAAVLC